MSSAVDICNEALARVGASRITSLDDESTEARVCKALYQSELDAMLDEYDWRFATTRLEIAADVAEPLYGWGYSYTIPTTVVRVIECDDGSADGSSSSLIDWQREGQQILCGFAGPLYLKVIQRIADPTRFPPSFQTALAYRLSSEMAIPLAQSQSMFESFTKKAAMATRFAQNRDGGQGRSQVSTMNSITAARY